MKILIAEDDFVSRRLLQAILLPYGSCDTAEDGREAVEKFNNAVKEKSPYDLICLDIMMPEMDGQEVLQEIRKLEEEHGIVGLDGVKIIMVTALGDYENVIKAFRDQCEAYYIKPINKERLLETIQKLGLIEEK